MHIDTHVHVCTYVYIYIYTQYTYVYNHSHIHFCILMHTCAFDHTHINTYTLTTHACAPLFFGLGWNIEPPGRLPFCAVLHGVE